MRSSTRLMLVVMTALFCSRGLAQTTVSYETFPMQFNLSQQSPQNTTFQGDIGLWGAYSSDMKSYLTVNGALKLYNWSTANRTAASVVRATSPLINCHTTCLVNVALKFDLYTHTVNQNNTCFTVRLDVSSDNGGSWTTLWSKTSTLR